MSDRTKARPGMLVQTGLIFAHINNKLLSVCFLTFRLCSRKAKALSPQGETRDMKVRISTRKDKRIRINILPWKCCQSELKVKHDSHLTWMCVIRFGRWSDTYSSLYAAVVTLMTRSLWWGDSVSIDLSSFTQLPRVWKVFSLLLPILVCFWHIHQWQECWLEFLDRLKQQQKLLENKISSF